MIDVLKELERRQLDPGKLTLEILTRALPSYFRTNSDEICRWACFPGLNSWGVVVYLYPKGRSSVVHQFVYDRLETSICHMLLWLLDNNIISYHQIIDLL